MNGPCPSAGGKERPYSPSASLRHACESVVWAIEQHALSPRCGCAERKDCTDYLAARSVSILASCNRGQVEPTVRAIGVAVPRKWLDGSAGFQPDSCGGGPHVSETRRRQYSVLVGAFRELEAASSRTDTPVVVNQGVISPAYATPKSAIIPRFQRSTSIKGNSPFYGLAWAAENSRLPADHTPKPCNAPEPA